MSRHRECNLSSAAALPGHGRNRFLLWESLIILKDWCLTPYCCLIWRQSSTLHHQPSRRGFRISNRYLSLTVPMQDSKNPKDPARKGQKGCLPEVTWETFQPSPEPRDYYGCLLAWLNINIFLDIKGYVNINLSKVMPINDRNGSPIRRVIRDIKYFQ